MSKSISDQIREIIGELETREKPDMIWMSREQAELMALQLNISFEDLPLLFLDQKIKKLDD